MSAASRSATFAPHLRREAGWTSATGAIPSREFSCSLPRPNLATAQLWLRHNAPLPRRFKLRVGNQSRLNKIAADALPIAASLANAATFPNVSLHKLAEFFGRCKELTRRFLQPLVWSNHLPPLRKTASLHVCGISASPQMQICNGPADVGLGPVPENNTRPRLIKIVFGTAP